MSCLPRKQRVLIYRLRRFVNDRAMVIVLLELLKNVGTAAIAAISPPSPDHYQPRPRTHSGDSINQQQRELIANATRTPPLYFPSAHGWSEL